MTGPGHKRRAVSLACHEQKCAASRARQARFPVKSVKMPLALVKFQSGGSDLGQGRVQLR